MTGLTDLPPREAAARILAARDADWIDRLGIELDRQLGGRSLQRIKRIWGLSTTELGALFGVSRQAVSKWLDGGVPSDRIPVVADVQAITDLLDRHLKADRIPAVVRRAAPRLGDRSLVDLVADDRSNDALTLTRRMFTFTDLHG